MKYLLLENVISAKSDKDGNIKFENLTALGHLGPATYLMISVDGVAIPWTDRYNPLNPETPLPPQGILPMLVESDTAVIEIIS